MSSRRTFRMVLSAMFLALALVLPFLIGQIPEIGKALCPMHIPVFLCAFFCGPWYAAVIGFIAPLLRGVMFGMPALMPMGIGMAFELAAYGIVTGVLYQMLPKKKPYIYCSLLGAMVVGRIVWGVVRAIIAGVTQTEFGMEAFVAGALTTAIPGIILHIILIPIIVMALQRYTAD